MTKFFLRLFKDVPVGQKPPGVHGDWPMTIYPVDDDEPDPQDGRIVMEDQAALDAYLEQERPAFDAANAASAIEQQAWEDSLELPGAKVIRFQQIDARTEQLIGAGFTYAGKQFSLSAAAQLKLIGAFNARDLLMYPVVWNTLDDLDAYSIQDAAEMNTIYHVAVDAVRAALDSGTALKDLVRAADTMAALNSIVDSR